MSPWTVHWKNLKYQYIAYNEGKNETVSTWHLCDKELCHCLLYSVLPQSFCCSPLWYLPQLLAFNMYFSFCDNSCNPKEFTLPCLFAYHSWPLYTCKSHNPSFFFLCFSSLVFPIIIFHFASRLQCCFSSWFLVFLASLLIIFSCTFLSCPHRHTVCLPPHLSSSLPWQEYIFCSSLPEKYLSWKERSTPSGSCLSALLPPECFVFFFFLSLTSPHSMDLSPLACL